MKLKCIIVDDEPLAAMLLEGYAAKTPFLDHIATYSSAIEAVHSDRLGEADLIFLDIQMPTLSGLEFSRMLPESCKVIFTTAFNEYALDGFKVNALDYLVKPIPYSDFLASSQRALEWYELKRRAEQSEEGGGESLDHIYVKSDYKLLRIDLKRLLYVEGLKDYVKFVVEDEPKPILSLMNMKRAEEILRSDDFLRVHRSFIVRKDKISVVERGRILFDDQVVPVGDTYKTEFQDFLKAKS